MSSFTIQVTAASECVSESERAKETHPYLHQFTTYNSIYDKTISTNRLSENIYFPLCIITNIHEYIMHKLTHEQYTQHPLTLHAYDMMYLKYVCRKKGGLEPACANLRIYFQSEIYSILEINCYFYIASSAFIRHNVIREREREKLTGEQKKSIDANAIGRLFKII